MDKDAAVAKRARREDRERHKRTLPARRRDQKGPHRKLGDIELLEAKHAPKNLFYRQDQIGDIDSLGLHRALPQGPRAIIVFTSYGQRKVRHKRSPGLGGFFHLLNELACLLAHSVAPSRCKELSQEGAAQRQARHSQLHIFPHVA